METHKISGKAILADINAGMTDSALMEKQHLSEHNLHIVFQKQLDMRVLKQEDLQKRQERILPAEVVIGRSPEEQGEPPGTQKESSPVCKTSNPQEIKPRASESLDTRGQTSTDLWREYGDAPVLHEPLNTNEASSHPQQTDVFKKASMEGSQPEAATDRHPRQGHIPLLF